MNLTLSIWMALALGVVLGVVLGLIVAKGQRSPAMILAAVLVGVGIVAMLAFPGYRSEVGTALIGLCVGNLIMGVIFAKTRRDK